MTSFLYAQRLKEHLQGASAHFNQGDYVQAGEKVWGALAALVNARRLGEGDIMDVNSKEAAFARLFQQYAQKNPSIHRQLAELQCRNERELFRVAHGLHKYFYGGTNLSRDQVSVVIPFLIELIGCL
jgi:hypothetical protein